MEATGGAKDAATCDAAMGGGAQLMTAGGTPCTAASGAPGTEPGTTAGAISGAWRGEVGSWPGVPGIDRFALAPEPYEPGSVPGCVPGSVPSSIGA